MTHVQSCDLDVTVAATVAVLWVQQKLSLKLSNPYFNNKLHSNKITTENVANWPQLNRIFAWREREREKPDSKVETQSESNSITSNYYLPFVQFLHREMCWLPPHLPSPCTPVLSHSIAMGADHFGQEWLQCISHQRTWTKLLMSVLNK